MDKIKKAIKKYLMITRFSWAMLKSLRLQMLFKTSIEKNPIRRMQEPRQ